MENTRLKDIYTVHSFSLNRVRLLDSPFKDCQERNRKYLRSLDPGRLLHTFRINAGISSDAEPLGGWENPSGELRGHFVGHRLERTTPGRTR